MWLPSIAVSLGAVAGALVRWQLGDKLNKLYPFIPPGTIAANIIGSFIVGVAICYFAQASDIAPEWKLFIVTGFCGALTTFSTFSAEAIRLIQEGRATMAMAAIAIHVMGSLLATFSGIALAQLLFNKTP